MPAATTHVEFARDVFNSLSPALQDGIKNMPLYYLGSQGPDFFFFSRLMALPGSLKYCGDTMHEIKIAETIRYMDEYTARESALRSYFYGFLTHYALDSTAHPLICAFAAEEHAVLGTHETEAHFREEGEIDVYVLNRKNRSAHQYGVYTDLKVTKQDAALLAKMYHELLLDIYGIDAPVERIRQTAGEVYFATRALKPNRLKFALVEKIESLAGAPHLISGMMLENKKSLPAVLNLAHREWEVPGYGGLKDTRSFDDLYQEALEKAIHLMKKREPEDFDRSFVGLPIPIISW